MIPLVDATNVGLFGPVCSGKTFLLRKWLETQNRYVRFDYTGETNREGDPTVEHFYKPLPLLDRLERNPYYFRVAYHPGRDVMEHYRWCQRAVWMFDTPRWLAVDEYHRVCPQGPRLDPDVESALRLARHNQLGLIGASQRPQDVNKLFVDSCRMCIVYRSQEENFLNACAGHWGADVAQAVATMRPLVFDDSTKQVKQVPQCVVITRDGQPARLYDFQTDAFLPLVASTQWLATEGENNDDEDAAGTNLDEGGTLRKDVSTPENNTAGGGGDV